MIINNVSVANINETTNFVPYNNGNGFIDSGYEVMPPPTNAFGIVGLKSKVGFSFNPLLTNDIPDFGFLFGADVFNGTVSYIGDYSKSYNSTFFQIRQFPNSSLELARIQDNFNGNRYLNILPNQTVYGIGNDVSSINSMNMGFIIDGINGIGACYFTNGFGLDFNPQIGQVRIGNMSGTGAYIGVDTGQQKMIVSNQMLKNSQVSNIVAYIDVTDEFGNLFAIPLYQ